MNPSDCESLLKDLVSIDQKIREKASSSLSDLNHGCERISASTYSPGLVKNDELLFKLIFCPQHIDENSRQIKPSAFHQVISDSMIRLLLLGTTECLQKLAHSKTQVMKANNLKDRELQAGLVISVDLLRNTTSNDKRRVFGVYDTALKEDRTHADVVRRSLGKQEKAAIYQGVVQKSTLQMPEDWEVNNESCYCPLCNEVSFEN